MFSEWQFPSCSPPRHVDVLLVQHYWWLFLQHGQFTSGSLKDVCVLHICQEHPALSTSNRRWPEVWAWSWPALLNVSLSILVDLSFPFCIRVGCAFPVATRASAKDRTGRRRESNEREIQKVFTVFSTPTSPADTVPALPALWISNFGQLRNCHESLCSLFLSHVGYDKLS